MRTAVRLLPLVLLLSGCPRHAPMSLRAPTEQSDFIFKGTVLKVGDSNLPQVPASPSTATVRVDQMIDGPESLGDHSGKEVTIELREPAAVKEGRSFVFFTHIGLFGRTLGLREVEHRPGDLNPAELRKQVAAVRSQIRDDRLAERIKTADLVVLGRVAEIKPLERREPIESEHDPEWRVATIQVESSVKGQPDKTLRIVYPASRDVAWFRAPKPVVGREAIWILRRRKLPSVPEEAFTAFEPEDVLDRSQLERVRRLASGVSR